MRTFIIMSAVVGTLLATAAEAKTRILVLPPDAARHGPTLAKYINEAAVVLPTGDRILVYSSRPIAQIAAFERPSEQGMNAARSKAALSAQFRPVRDYLSAAPSGVAGDFPGNLMIPQLMDELARNVVSSAPEKRADVLLIGSLLHYDRRDSRASMTERYVPGDGVLRAPRAEWVFNTAEAQDRLAGSVLHFCSPDGETEYESSQHAERLHRFWSLWTTTQGGTVGTFSTDLATCFRRWNAGDTSGQPIYQLSKDTKAEMVRVPANTPVALPANYETPGQWFLRDDVTISKTLPTSTKGILWVGIKWSASCDLDLYSRAEPSSPWLYFGSGRTAEGHFNKDFTIGSGGSYEYIEYTREVDVARTEVLINLYACDASTPPEGTLRVWISGRVFEAPFKLASRTGNRGAMPIAAPYWIRMNLMKTVGLSRE